MQKGRTIRFFLLCTLLLLTGATLVQLPFTTSKARAALSPLRIMPLGDSITGSPGCWRALLWNDLQNSGYTNIDFVGTLPPPVCGIPYDGDNEGHGGILATGIANQNLLPGWLEASNPDIVLMHLGTNDVWHNIPTATILNAYSTLIEQMRTKNPLIKIFVAQIIPMQPANCPACAREVIALNKAIPAWASTRTTISSPILVIDQWTGFDDHSDTIDGVHPNDAGNQKIASKWFSPLATLLRPLLIPTLTSTTTTALMSTITPVDVVYTIQNQ